MKRIVQLIREYVYDPTPVPDITEGCLVIDTSPYWDELPDEPCTSDCRDCSDARRCLNPPRIGGLSEFTLTNLPPICELDDPGPKIRVTNAESGGQKERNLFRYGLIPWEMLRGLARHYGLGAFKYTDDNWRKGYDWSLSYDALLRHLEAWRSGESTTVETVEKDGQTYRFRTHHLIAVIWQATTLYCFELWGIGRDDVRKKGTP